MQNQTDLYEYKTYSAVDFIIGLFITLGASLANACGLNIVKLDFTRQEALPAAQRRPDWKRPYWLLGQALYIASQLLGSTLALEYLRAEYVAPLGSTSLIFNFIFAYLLVGTPVTRLDIAGTCVIVLGVVGVVLFGNHRDVTDFDKESNLSLSLLKEIWGRKGWIVYLTFLELTTLVFFWLSGITHEVCMARVTDERGSADRDADIDGMLDGGGGRRIVQEDGGVKGLLRKVKGRHGKVRRWIKRGLEKWSQSRPDSTIRKVAGIAWSITGGLLAGQTLVLAKSFVKLVSSAISKSDPNQSNQFTSPLTWLIVILLVVAAVSQIYCLNAALKCADSTLAIPVFFATYTTAGFINSLVYLDELDSYRPWVFACIWISIAVLVSGVIMLSIKKPQARQRTASVSAEDGMEMASQGGATKEVVKTEELKKGQGWLGRMFGGRPVDVVATTGAAATKVPGEASRKERRKGAQQLGDEDDLEVGGGGSSSKGGAGGLEDEVDVLGKHDKSAASGSQVFGIDDDDFGDFKHAPEQETTTR